MPKPTPTIEELTAKTAHFLAYRARSKKEVERYLKRKTNQTESSAVIEKTIADLEQFNLVNDTVFARQVAESYLRSGKGPKIIALKLREKGVERAIIAQVIENLDAAMIQEAARAALTKKIKTVHEPNSSKKRQLLFKFLYSRGFETKLGYELIDAKGGLTVQ